MFDLHLKERKKRFSATDFNYLTTIHGFHASGLISEDFFFFLLKIKNIISSLSRQISNCLEHWDVHDYQKNTFSKLGQDSLP